MLIPALPALHKRSPLFNVSIGLAFILRCGFFMVETISQSHGVRLLRPQNLGASFCFLARISGRWRTHSEVKMMPIVSSTYQTCQSYPKHTYHTHSQFICRNMSSMVCVGVDFADFTGVRFCPLYRSFDVVLSTICIVQYHTFCSYLLSPRQAMIHLGNQGIGATAC